MKKRYYILVVFGLFIFFGGAYILLIPSESEEHLFEKNSGQIKAENTLSMMLETAYQSGEYNMTTQSSWPTDGYEFNATLSKCENGSELSWDDENKMVTMTGNMSDKCYVYFDKLYIPTLAEYIIKQYGGTQGNNNIYHHDGSLTYGIEDGSYRYAGGSSVVENYVCMGSDASECPTSNLFRIIGVFDNKVKLISAEPATTEMLGTDGDYARNATSVDSIYAGSYSATEFTNVGVYSWNGNTSDLDWGKSYLNSVNLNKNFLNFLGTSWSDLIDTSSWIVSYNEFSKISVSTIKVAYQNEIVSPESSSTYEAKVGLPYVNDYGFSADSSMWNMRYSNYVGAQPDSTLDNNNYYKQANSSNNWMYLGLPEWSLATSPTSVNNPIYLPLVSAMHFVIINLKETTYFDFYSRPTFYLKDTVLYAKGTGTKSNPYRVQHN